VCLDTWVHGDILLIESYIREYIVSLKNSLTYIRSIDGFLVKIGSIIYDLEDKCRDKTCDPKKLLKEILSAKELRSYLSRFSCYRDEIFEKINSDPRHKNLRRYFEVLKETLESIECTGEGEVILETPPATWAKERIEPRIVIEEEIRERKKFSFDLYSLIKTLLIVSIAIFIITLVLIFTH